MNRRLFVTLLVALPLAGCVLLEPIVSPSSSPFQPPAAAEALAVVNGVRLMRADLNRRMSLTQVVTWLTTGSAPSELDEERATNQWIDSELMAQAAAKANVTASISEAEEEVARLLGEARLDETDLLRQLNVAGITRDELLAYEQRAVAIKKFTETNVLAGASESERPGRLATWLSHERGAAKIEKPTVATGPKLVGVYAGAIAPNFTLQGLDGDEKSLESLRGKVVLVNFWATWCGPCRAEMPAIQRTYDAHKDEGLVVWGVNVGESAEQVRSYAHELNLNFPLLLDGDSKISRQYRVFGLPTSVFVGRDGVILDVTIGELNQSTLDSYVKRILN